MAVKNKWAILFAGIAGILSVWGYWGGGTAAGLLPEKNKNIEVSSASGEASDGFSEGRMDGGSRKVYDAALHRREGPMKDPFHVAGRCRGSIGSRKDSCSAFGEYSTFSED